MRTEVRRIAREELLRSIAWFGLGIVGWPILISEFTWLDANVLTVFGLPLLTWAVLTVGVIGARAATSAEIQVTTPVGLSMSLLVGIVFGGVSAVYLVAVAEYAALPVTIGYVTVAGGTVLWHWYTRLPDSSPDMPA